MVDALVSGTSVSDDVKVRVLSWAPRTPSDESLAGFRFIFLHKLGTLAHFSFHLNIFCVLSMQFRFCSMFGWTYKLSVVPMSE